MPWKETNPMNQRQPFCKKATARGVNMSELCREYEISRKTGHKWKARYLKQGEDRLRETSRRPRRCPESLPEDTVCAIVRLKNAHPTWGPKKIRELYRRARPEEEPPSESSFKRVL